MVFYWLKTKIKVRKILEVVVDDGVDRKKPHSDQAIIRCLEGLAVETLDWQRMDIPAEVIIKGAGMSSAVLQSWADTNGRSKPPNVSKVIV
ncbi:hypothetical protein V8C34DRAFT_312621 [Trichoderma compactum]